MRLIYGLLAIRMLRLARFDLAQSDPLYRSGDEAFELSRERVRQTEVLAAQAELPSLTSMR